MIANIATMQATFHPKEAPYWYLAAAAIGDSRLVLGRHRIADVLAGAALGYAVAKLELADKDGWVISPLMTPAGGYGLSVSMRF